MRSAIGVILLLIIAWTVLWAYLSLNKGNLEARIEKAIRQKTNAEVYIGDLNISILHTFPFISLELSKVIVRDSLWARHKHDLLNVEEIYTQINPLKIVLGKTPFNKVDIENGKFYQYTDSTGYSNIKIFLKQDSSTQAANEDYPDISGKNIEFIVEKRLQHKIFDLEINWVKNNKI